MFEGGGYGVAVTAGPVGPMPWDDVPAPPGVVVRPTRLSELMPVETRTDAELDAELERIVRAVSALAAYKAAIVARRARGRPAARDLAPGAPGAASPDWAPQPGDDPLVGVSEFFPDELAMTLRCSRAAATATTDISLTLLERLPTTWAALADGDLDWPRARAIAQELGWPARECAPEVVTDVEAAVLPRAMELSIPRLRSLVQRELLTRDAAAADARRKRAERTADVRLHSLGDGMVELRAAVPAPLGAAVRESVDTYARMAKADGDPRPLGQLRAAFLADLVLRPWDTSRPPVTAHLTVLAPLDALSAGTRSWFARSPFAATAVAEVDGMPVTAAHLRELLHRLDALGEHGLRAPAGGSLLLALTEPHCRELRATLTRGELERLARRGCPDHRDGDCACPLLDRPAATDRYRPTPAQYRYTRTRDRTCRHPGCTDRAGWSDLDHVTAHADGGATDCTNLCCLCRRHHRLKTHAPGWRFTLEPDGTLHVTTPTGVTRTTRPPGVDLLHTLPATAGRDHPPPGPPPARQQEPPPF